MRNEVKYGLRFLVRDTLSSERRVQALLAHERLPREQLEAVTDRLLTDTLRAATRHIPRYHGVKTPIDGRNARDALVTQFPII
jgi:hypothetical protein